MKKSMLILVMLVIAVPVFADVLVFDTFEDDVVGELPQNWQVKDGVTNEEFPVVNSPVKNGSKALKFNSVTNDHDMWIEFGRSVAVVSVEFWIYPDQEGRSLTLLLLNGSTNRADAGPYLGWAAGTTGVITRYSGGWGATNTSFTVQDWTYVKLMANSDTDTFDLYFGAGPNDLPTAPQEPGLTYRVATDGFDRVMLLGWSDVAGPAYIDDILVYEGDTRPADVITAVDPSAKAAAMWSGIKSDY